jgi:Uma2 family endonuclease
MVSHVAQATPSPSPRSAEPAWEIARLFPNQGHWSEGDYLDLSGNRLVEFDDGFIEVLSMPTMVHQMIVLFLCDALRTFATAGKLGSTLIAPFRVRLRPGKYREPDVMFMLARNAHRMSNEFWDGADLVMEVVSDDFRKHDLETKRLDYALAGIPEYWIVDPMLREITVLKLTGDHYEVHGVFKEGNIATSLILPDFTTTVVQVFAAGDGK